jgi:hypothetical protein
MSVAVRWTVGDVSSRGFETLALSISGARNVFGPSARYIVCVNTIGIAAAKSRVGEVAEAVEWMDTTSALPDWLLPWLNTNLADGVAWKFAGMQVCSDRPTLSLDNDVILWRMPPSVREWLKDADSFLIAEDVLACHGNFSSLCPGEPRNSGIVGIPPHFDLESAIRSLLCANGVRLSAETDEQGLQVALVTSRKHRVVRVHEVSVSGYFRPHMLEVGSCGAHFVGVNVKDYPLAHGFWDDWKLRIAERVAGIGLDLPLAG